MNYVAIKQFDFNLGEAVFVDRVPVSEIYNRRNGDMRYSDHHVVAAVNGCIDFDKLRQLPDAVTQRFKDLLKHHRVRAVCFFTQVGFGLRVYQEPPEGVTFDGDEATFEDGKEYRVDTEGCWVRCPPAPLPEPDEWMVMDSRGRQFYSEHETDVDGDESWGWTGTNGTPARNRAKKFKREEAEQVAQRVGGVVVKA